MPSDAVIPPEIVTTATVTPVAVVEPAPVVVAEPAAPVIEVVQPAEVMPEPVAELPAEAVVVEPTSLLSEAGKPEEAKPGETKPEAEKPAEPVAEVPVVYEMKVPEGITVIPEKMAEFTTLLGEHKISPEVGQALLDRHTRALQEFVTHQGNEQVRVFNDTRRQWVNEVKADPELGGSGFNTTMTAVARMRDKFVPETRLKAFNDMCAYTGVGDHPEFLRFLNNVARALDEPSSPSVAYKPPADIGRAPKQTGGRLSNLYDKPMTNRGS